MLMARGVVTEALPSTLFRVRTEDNGEFFPSVLEKNQIMVFTKM